MHFLGRKLAAYFRHPSRMRYKLIAIFGDLFSFDRREQVLSQAMAFVNHGRVVGEYLEFGVWKGGSLSAAYHLSRKHKDLSDMRFFGFDSFEGLPEIEGKDKSTGEFQKGEYMASEDTVRAALKKNGVDMARVELVKGWYDKSLTPALRQSKKIQKAAIAYIDCDLYESTVPVLEFLTPLLQDGTIIIFDDWFCFRGHPDRGEQLAFREWTTKHGIKASPYKQFGWTGLSWIIHQD